MRPLCRWQPPSGRLPPCFPPNRPNCPRSPFWRCSPRSQLAEPGTLSRGNPTITVGVLATAEAVAPSAKQTVFPAATLSFAAAGSVRPEAVDPASVWTTGTFVRAMGPAARAAAIRECASQSPVEIPVPPAIAGSTAARRHVVRKGPVSARVRPKVSSARATASVARFSAPATCASTSV